MSLNNIPQKHLIVIFNQFADRVNHIEVEKKYIDNGGFFVAHEFWLSNSYYKNLKKH